MMLSRITPTPPERPPTPPGRPRFDLARVRADFPILSTTVHGKPLVYLDNGATTQKPRAVIERLQHYYRHENANIHRGIHTLSKQATLAYEAARRTVQQFLNAAEPAEIIFTRGTTESINLVAASWGRAFLRPGDEVIVSGMEHHSNIVPWQLACQASGAALRVIPVNDAGELMMDEYQRMLSPRTRMVSIVHISNSLGTINDVKTIAKLAHAVGARVLIDGAQHVAHRPTDVRDLDCDFYAFSGHKLFGPTGIGVLWGRRELLEAMPPYQGGGDMIESVTFEKTTYAQLPNKFEAGTPHIAGVLGLAAAIEYLQSLGFDSFADHEADLLAYGTQRLAEVPGLRIVGQARHKACIFSFVLEDPPVSTFDIAMWLDGDGIAVRTGHHCCQPLMDRLGIAGTARASLSLYNTREEIDALVASLKRLCSAAPRTRQVHAGGQTALVFPEPAADSPAAAAADLIEAFEFLGDWDQRYAYLLELARKLPPMPPELKTEATRVHGCQSTVHLYSRKRPGTTDGFDFLADSDAELVRGLIAVLQRVFAGQPAGQIVAFDVDDFFRKLGLEDHLTLGRRNGLQAMVRRIKSLAAAMLKPGGEAVSS